MLNAVAISHIFVFDQGRVLDFYVGKLGLEVSAGDGRDDRGAGPRTYHRRAAQPEQIPSTAA